MKKKGEKGLISDSATFRKYIFWTIVVALLALSFFLIRPYVIALISAFILAYLVRPVHTRLKPKLGNSFSAVLCILLILIILIIPVGVIVGGITKQAYGVLSDGGAANILNNISGYLESYHIDVDMGQLAEKGVGIVISLFQTALEYIPALIISLFVTLFGVYYFLVDWESFVANIQEYLPFRKKDLVVNEISQATHALVYGTLLVGFIEFIVMAIGLYLSGVDSYLFLAAIVFFFAFIPGLGPALVWIPCALYMVITKQYYPAVGVLITGLVVGIGIDEFLRARILGDKSHIHPLVMLVGLLGGISLFGIFGFIIGPLILVYTVKLLREGMKSY